MKIAVIFSTRSGTARECAERFAACLHRHEVTLIELGQDKLPPLADFDALLVGGPIRFDKLDRRLRTFLSEHRDELAEHCVGYFICCAFADLADEYLERNVPEPLRDTAVFARSFGGELNPAKQKNVFAKLAVRAMINDIEENGDSDDETEARVMPSILPEEIANAAEKLIKAAASR